MKKNITKLSVAILTALTINTSIFAINQTSSKSITDNTTASCSSPKEVIETTKHLKADINKRLPKTNFVSTMFTFFGVACVADIVISQLFNLFGNPYAKLGMLIYLYDQYCTDNNGKPPTHSHAEKFVHDSVQEPAVPSTGACMNCSETSMSGKNTDKKFAQINAELENMPGIYVTNIKDFIIPINTSTEEIEGQGAVLARQQEDFEKASSNLRKNVENNGFIEFIRIQFFNGFLFFKR